MHRRLWRAYTALSEQRYTKLTRITCRSKLDVLVAKASSSDDLPIPEPYVWELALAFSSSPSSSRSFALSFTRRFGQTKSWCVALKCLLLLHLLLRLLPPNHSFRADFLSARANALITLHPCHFRDASSSQSDHFTRFVHCYARLVDEVMIMNFSGSNSITTYKALELVQQLQSLIDWMIDCVPAANKLLARRSPIVRSVMKEVARETFTCYLASRQSLMTVLDGILEMPYRSCIEGLTVYKRAADQAVRLGEFFSWCREMGYCSQYEYPLVDMIPKIQVAMLESFVEQMWQLTTESSPSLATEGKSDYNEVVISEEWDKFEEEDEEGNEKALIRFEDDDHEMSWEVVLDASVSWSLSDVNADEQWKSWERENAKDEKSLQLFNPHLFNPFFWS